MRSFVIVYEAKVIGEGTEFSNGLVSYSRTTPDMKSPHLDNASSLAQLLATHPPQWDICFKRDR